jgi:hypothetical protein
MAKKEKHFIEVKFLDLKEKFKAGELTTEEIDQITCEMIAELAVLTVKGITEINGTPIDLYKDRVFWIVEKAGLLPPYRDEEDDIEEEFDEEDDYYKVDEDEDDFEIDDSKFYR